MSQFCDEDDDWRLQKQKSAAPLLMQPPAAEDDRSSLGLIKKKTVALRKYTGSYISTTATSFKCGQMTVLLSWLYVTLIWAIIL